MTTGASPLTSFPIRYRWRKEKQVRRRIYAEMHRYDTNPNHIYAPPQLLRRPTRTIFRRIFASRINANHTATRPARDEDEESDREDPRRQHQRLAAPQRAQREHPRQNGHPEEQLLTPQSLPDSGRRATNKTGGNNLDLPPWSHEAKRLHAYKVLEEEACNDLMRTGMTPYDYEVPHQNSML